MSEEGHPAHKKTVVWLSIGTDDGVTKLHLQDLSSRKVRAFKKPIVQEKTIASPDEANAETKEPVAPPEEKEADSKTKPATKTELLEKTTLFTQAFIWSGDSLLKKTIQCLNNQDEEVRVVDLSTFKPKPGQQYHVKTDQAQYWAVEVQKTEYFLIIDLPKESELDFSQELTCLADVIRSSRFEPKRTVEQRIKEQITLLISKTKEVQEIAEKGSENQKKADQKPQATEKEEKKPKDFNYQKWRQELKTNNTSLIKLLENFSHKYTELRVEGPWQEQEYKKDTSKESEKKPKMIPLDEVSFDSKLEKLLAESLTVKVVIKDKAPEYEDVDFRNYFVWYEIKAFSDVLNYDAGLLSQFFSNPLVRGGFLYNIRPSSLLDALTLKASEDEAPPELEYSDCLNLFLDYCVRSSQDCIVFFELLIFAITDPDENFKLSLLDKEKLLGLLCDLFAEFRRPLLKELARESSADFLKQLLAVFRQAIKQSTKAFDLVIGKVFGTEVTPLRKKFYESLYFGEGKLQACHLYQRLLDDKTLDILGKASLFERFLDDTSICHHAQFLTLIDKSLETGVHLELLHNTLNQTLQKASKGKIPEAKNEDPFLRYCLKHLLGDSYATIITRFIKGLNAAKKEQADDPKDQNKLKCVEDKNSILNNFYKVLTKFVTVDLPKDKIKADFLVEKDAFSDRQEFIKSLFGDFEKVFNQKVQKAAEALNEFREARKTIDSNTAYLKDRAYTKTALDRITNLESSFKNLTLAEIYSNDDYKNLKFLRSDYWKKLSPYLRLQATSEELDKLADSCKSIYELTEKLTAYIDSTKAKFESFANPSKYNYKNSQLYFKTANKESDFKHYTTILKQMDVAIFLTTDILQNSCSFAAYRKIMKLTDAIVAIRDMPLMKRRSSIWVDKMVSIQEKFKNRAPETITLNEVQEFEGTESLLKEKLFRRLPDCLLHIAKCPKALEFIKNKEDQLIRSMRDDCESEDTDIVNKLEALNRSLKSITKPEELESIDDVLRLVHALDKKARDQISNWLDEVDSNATHLEYVFQKAQKGTHFQKTQVLSIMNSAKIIIQFSTKREAFEASAVAGLTHEVIGADEFVELFGLIKIIVSDSSEGPEVDPHNDHAKLQDFSRLGDTLKQLLSQIAWLRRCGLIDKRFTPPVMSKIADLSRGAVGFSQSSDAMEIEFNHSRNSLRMLKDLVENLAQVEKEITKCLTDDVQNWSLFTNFSGRKLYYLTQLLEGQVDEASDRRQIVNVITEANDVSEADVDALTRAHTRFRPAEQLEDYLRSVQEYMIKFTDDVVSNDLDVSKKDVLMMDLKQRAIKIASTGSHNSKLDKSNSSQLKTEINEFEAILKLLYASNQSAMISLSQLFYCSPELNIFDLIAFLQRALRDRFGRFYFIINADSMSEDTFSEFLAYSESIINHHASNYNLLVFMNERKRIEKLEQMEAFTLCTEDLSALIQKVDRRSIVEKFADAFKKNQIVHSASAGMGKTKYISESAAGSSLVDVFLAGEINEHTVTTRVGSVVEQIRAAKDLVVCLKLDFIEDFQSHARLVDFILFYTCFLCKIPTEKGCYPFGDKLKKIYIELGNTFVNTLLEKSAVLRIMCWEECEEVLRPWKMVYHVAEFKLENISSLSLTNPEEQTAMKLLSITKKSQAKTVIASIESVSEADSHKLISEYFIKYQHCKKDIKSVTFAQYKFWIKMLALLGQEVDDIDELRPDMIKTPIKTVRVEIFNEIVYLASHLSNFTVEQARSSQEEMKKLVATMQSTGSIVSNVEKYKERFKKPKPWACMNFILPMLNPAKQKFMLAMYKAGMLENPQDLFRCSNQRQSSETLVSEKKWYNTSYDKHVMFARMLATYLGEPENGVVERSTKYTLTGDNYMKICLMILKSKMKLPIVIMGESGCGKTELIEYVAKTLLRHPYRKITLYSGLPETSLLNTIEECVIEALKLPQGQDFWLFFDEFNTSSLQSLVCEIMIDRTCSVGSPSSRKSPKTWSS
jgi:hypothetical protein